MQFLQASIPRQGSQHPRHAIPHQLLDYLPLLVFDLHLAQPTTTTTSKADVDDEDANANEDDDADVV